MDCGEIVFFDFEYFKVNSSDIYLPYEISMVNVDGIPIYHEYFGTWKFEKGLEAYFLKVVIMQRLDLIGENVLKFIIFGSK